MGYFFRPSQIAEVAAEVEEIGAEFYSRVARINVDHMVQEACLLLADEELKHRDTFEEIGRDARTEDGALEWPLDVVGKMKALVVFLRERIFTISVPDALTASTREILQTAVRIEEQIIQIYEEMYFSLKGVSREMLREILYEENRHLMMLLNVQEALNLR